MNLRKLFPRFVREGNSPHPADISNSASRQLELQQALEHIIQTEWEPSQLVCSLDLYSQCAELEKAGFQAEFVSRFHEFVELLYILYDNAIRGENIGARISYLHSTGRLDYPQRKDSHSLQLPFELCFSTQLLRLPEEEKYKLEVPAYILAKAAKELVKASPIGTAITEYRKAHHFLPLSPTSVEGSNPYQHHCNQREYQEAGIQMIYTPSICSQLRDMQSTRDRENGKPYLSGSDAGEGDFYFAAFDLLSGEECLLRVIEHNAGDRIWDNNGDRIKLVRPGIKLSERYAQRFLLAKHKLEKYGVENLGNYFRGGEVGEEGKEGQLRLFLPNPPKGTMYYC